MSILAIRIEAKCLRALVVRTCGRIVGSLGGVLLALLTSRVGQAAWPSLDQAIERAKTRAPSVIQAEGAVMTARSYGVGARMSSFSNPYLEVIADQGLSRNTGAELTVLGQLFLPIEVAGQRAARIREADSFLGWYQMARLDVQARAVGAVVIAYGDSLVAASRITLAELAEAEAKAEYAYFVGRAQAGDATVVDRGLAEAEAARYGQVRAESQLFLIRSLEELSVLTDLSSLDPPREGNIEPPTLRSKSFAEYIESVMAQSPALRSLDLETRYWSQQVERAEAERSPPVSLILSGGRGELGEARVGGGVAWTFPVVRRNEGEIARARSEQARARLVRPSVANTIRAQAQAAFDEYGVSRRAAEALDQVGIPASTRVVEATLESFRAGKLELVRVLNARRDLALARTRRLDLLSTAWRSYGDLAALRGERP